MFVAGESGRQTSQQGASRGRHGGSKPHHRDKQPASESAAHGDSESDTSGSPSAVSSYRVPIKPPASRSLGEEFAFLPLNILT
jgi:hypothetical protein